MKYAKKMVLVPDEEYIALMNLFTGGDAIKTEKAKTNVKIRQVLTNPRLSEGEKAAKYGLLHKKRRQLNKMIGDKEMGQIIVPQEGAVASHGASGVPDPVPEQLEKTNLQKAQEEEKHAVEEEQREKEAPEETLARTPGRTSSRQKMQKWDDVYGQISAEQAREIREHILQSNTLKAHMGINEFGSILKSKHQPATLVENAKLDDVLAFLAGLRQFSPDIIKDKNVQEAYSAVYKRIMSRPEFKTYFSQQGKGKRKKYIVERVPVKLKRTKRTEGLVRWKPTLWTKIKEI